MTAAVTLAEWLDALELEHDTAAVYHVTLTATARDLPTRRTRYAVGVCAPSELTAGQLAADTLERAGYTRAEIRACQRVAERGAWPIGAALIYGESW